MYERSLSLLAVVAALIAVLVPLPARAQCNWTPGTASITENCGNVGIGTATAPNHPLTVFGHIDRSQIRIANNSGTGILSLLGYGPDNTSIGFDVEYFGSWIARDDTVAWLYKNNDSLIIKGSGNNTVGAAAPMYDWVTVALANGATTFTNNSSTQTTIAGGTVSFSGIGSGLTFANGQRLYDTGSGNLRMFGNSLALDTTAGSIVASPANGLFGINGAPGVALDVAGANIRLKHTAAAMIIVEAPLSTPAGILLRAGGNESAHIVREATSADLLFYAGNGERLRIAAANGNVGIGGPTSAVERLILRNTFVGGMALHTGGTTVSRVHTALHDWLGLTVNMRYNGSAWVQDDTSKVGWGMALDTRTSEDALYVSRQAVNNGQVTQLLKLTATGDLTVAGNLSAKYQDVAEWVPATTAMSAGTVVVLNPDKSNEVMVANAAYDTSVAGVVSAQPGLILGEAGDGKAMIATTGRVKVRVRGPVKVGDLLVTSDKAGVAMPSAPIEFGGVKMHRPGTIIGKALEPLPSGEGEILVLLSLQ